VLYELKEAISGEVILVKAALYLYILVYIRLIVCLLLLNLGLELLLEGI